MSPQERGREDIENQIFFGDNANAKIIRYHKELKIERDLRVGCEEKEIKERKEKDSVNLNIFQSLRRSPPSSV